MIFFPFLPEMEVRDMEVLGWGERNRRGRVILGCGHVLGEGSCFVKF